MDSNKVAVYRREHFSSAHRLDFDDWDDKTNEEVFGRCSNPNFHGHNYELIVKVTGEPDPLTGFVINLKELKDIIKRKVTDRFDHKNLNLDVPDFNNLNPTVENIAIVIYHLLRSEITPAHDLQVRVYETERNFAEYPA